jgi:hypothetical protein
MSCDGTLDAGEELSGADQSSMSAGIQQRIFDEC